MRTFHFGGTATHKVETSSTETRFSGNVVFENIRAVKNSEGNLVVLSRTGEIKIVDNAEVGDVYPIGRRNAWTKEDGYCRLQVGRNGIHLPLRSLLKSPVGFGTETW